MLKAIHHIDLFGKAVLFNYRGHSKSKSKVGAFFTLALLGIIVWLVIDFGGDLVNKKDPKATTFDSFNDNPAATPLTSETFAFAIAITNPYFENFINESIFTVQASTYKTIRVPQPNGTVQITYQQLPIELERCQVESFGELAEKFSMIELNQMYCLKKDQAALNGSDIILEGLFESPVFQTIAIEFKICDNDTSAVTCGTPDEINRLLNGGMVSLSFSNMAVDLTDNKKPLKLFRDGWYTSIGSTFAKAVSLYLQQLEINTDSGWLTTDYNTENYVKYGEIQEIFTLGTERNFVYFNVRLGNVKKHFNRSYTKVQDIIAKVNGLIAVAFTIFVIVLAPYVRLKFYEALINEIFDIKLSKGDPKEKKNKKKGKQQVKTGLHSIEFRSKTLTFPHAKEDILTSQEDIEQQKAQAKPATSIAFKNKTQRPPKKAKTLKNVRNILSPEEISITDPPLSPLRPLNQEILESFETETYKPTEQVNVPKFKGQPGNPIRLRNSQPGSKSTMNLEIPKLTYSSSINSKSPRTSSSRRPEFAKFHMKILDYEDDGQDLIEDILKNIHQEQIKDNKTAMEENVTSMMKSEEKEIELLNQRNTKGGTYYTDIWPPETVVSAPDEEENKERVKNENETKETNEANRKYRLQRLQSVTKKSSQEIDLSLWEYLRSRFSRSEVIKEKMYIINEGIKRINERLDIFNLFKKLREFDKLKVLLLEEDQFVLFDSLPRPELAFKNKKLPHVVSSNQTILPQNNKIKDAQFIQEKIRNDLILLSYENLKRKENPTMLDRRLFDIYNDILGLQ